jgi:hypothetical protein
MFWLFQCNPNYFRIFDALNELPHISWPVRQYGRRMSVGDGVVIWITGSKAGPTGAYALGSIAEVGARPFSLEEESRYWVTRLDLRRNSRWASVKIEKPLPLSPLLRKQALEDPILKNLSVIRSPRGTNFMITDEEWARTAAALNPMAT